MSVNILNHFNSMPDSRVEQTKRYPLIEIIFLSICVVLSGAEDYSRIRTEASPENLAIIRHITLNMIRKDTSRKASVKRKRAIAALDDNFRSNLIEQGF